MSWAGISSNQTVSFANLLDAVNNGLFVPKTAITSSSEQITKADANTYVNIDTANAGYSAKTSGQLVVKSNLVALLANFTAECIIASGLGIKVDATLTRGGLLCTGSLINCNWAFDFCASCTVDDNNTLVAFNFNWAPTTPTGINYVACYYTAKNTGTYTINVTLYRNGTSIGSGSQTLAYIANTSYFINVALTSTQDFTTTNTILLLKYT
jgi:hypothetical protein